MIRQKKNTAHVILESLEEVPVKESIYYRLNNGDNITFTAEQLREEIENTGKFFLSLGLKKGDRILMYSKPSPFYLISILAAMKEEIVPILMDYSILREELNTILDDCEVKAVLTTESLMYKIPESYFESIPVLDITYKIELSKNSVRKVSENVPPTSVIHEETAYILFSSGTTSKRKGVELTHMSMLPILESSLDKIKLFENKSNLLCVLPFSHIAGLTAALSCIYSKSTLYMAEDMSAINIAKYLQEFNIEYIVLIPKIYEAFMIKAKEAINSKGRLISSIIYKLMDFSLFIHKKYNVNIGKVLFSSIREKMFGKNLWRMAAGGTAMRSDIMDFYTSLGYSMSNVYASTETSVQTVCTDLAHYDSSKTGKVLDEYIKVKLINCDRHGVGELVIKSPYLFFGYLNDEEATKNAYTEDGYFKTGDLAKIYSDGSISIEGRQKEAILLANGEKVSPEDIENSYKDIMDKLTFAVCGVQLSKTVQYDTVFMFIEGEFSHSEEEDIKQNILIKNAFVHADHRVSEIRFIKEIPRTSVGKVKRFSLKNIILNEGRAKEDVSEESKYEYLEDDTAEGKINTCIRKASKIDLSKVKILPHMNLFDDLGYDSLSIFELSTMIEEVFKKDISQELSAEITVQDIYDILEKGIHKEVQLDYSYDINDYPLKRNRFDEFVYNLIGNWYKKLYKIEYIGTENVPKDMPVVFAPNHICLLDPIILSMAFSKEHRRDIYTICWDKYTETRKDRYGMKVLQAIPLDRRCIGNPSSTLKIGDKCIHNNKSLIMFPEGTRTYLGDLGQFQNGPAGIAKHADVPVIPVTFYGMFDAFAKSQKGHRLFKNGKRIKIKVIFGKPVYGHNLSVHEITEKVREDIKENLNK